MAVSCGFNSKRRSIQKLLLFLYVFGLATKPCACLTPQSKPVEKFDRRIGRNCMLGCLLMYHQDNRKCFAGPVKSSCDKCLQKCSEKGMQRSRRSHSRILLLGPNDAVPRNLVMPDEIPGVPERLHDIINPEIRTFGNCDSGGEIFDINMKDPVLSKVISVSFVRKRNGVLVKWIRPDGMKNIKGYQINYRFGSGDVSSHHRRHPFARGMCYQVRENDDCFLIDKEKGFEGQDEVNLAVAALPLPQQCDLKMTRYPLLTHEDSPDFIDAFKVKRKRRTSRNGKQNTTTPTPQILILKPGASVPSNLIMPSKIPHHIYQSVKQINNSNCRAPEMRSDKTIYAGDVKITSVECQKAGNFTKKGFHVAWSLPNDYENKDFTAFQILYSVMPKRVYDVREQFCHQVGKNIRAYTITNVESTDTVHMAVVPYPVYDNMNVTLTRYTPCKTKAVKVSNDLDDETPPYVVAICTVTATVVLLVVAAAVFLYLRGQRTTPYPDPKSDRFYVSYYPDTQTHRNKVLHLVAKLRRNHSLNLIMDTTNQTQVAEFGLPRWCQKQLTDAAKIVMVVSKQYLKVCEEWQHGTTGETASTDANRVCWELQYVVDNIFQSRNNSRVLIVLADVKASELPDFLRGRHTQAWPKNENDVNSLACGILGQEVLVA